MEIPILLTAFILDLILGDPHKLPHPVRLMGKAITALEPRCRALPWHLTLSGALFASVLIGGTWCAAFLIVTVSGQIHPVLADIMEIILIYYCISASSLASAATDVVNTLQQQGLAQAKKKVAMIIGRDVASLSANGVKRGCVETVAENLVDGVIAPLFFAAIGGAPLAVAYKMVNTLDSMVGYKNETYRSFGKASARIDDIANYIPARLAIPIIALAACLLAAKGQVAFATAVAEGRNHSSPNAGYAEAAFAGVLGVRLNGPNFYGGKRVNKPYLGIRFAPEINSRHIRQACDLMFLSSLLWIIVLTIIEILRNMR
jgi:adenosylcobinamide-phosphate synthase